MLEKKFPTIVRDFTRSSISEAIEFCRIREDQQTYIPGLLRDLASTYTVEADLIEQKELSEDQENSLASWHFRATSVIGQAAT